MKMRKISKLLVVCCFALFATQQTKAQEETQLDCDFNFKEALSYIQLSQNFKKDSLKVVNLLKPCLEIGDAKAQLLMGRLYAVKGDEESNKKAFNLFKKSAKQGNAKAAGDLGVMYKYGRGCKLNFNKARKWFKKGAKLGNDKAAYSLGYLFLKGFGDINQDYSKAVKWFKKSEYPMAKYWLGTCYYYGYGVQQNINKANELLGTNFESAVVNNSPINTEDTTGDVSEQLEIDSEGIVALDGISESSLFGTWTGSLLKYDWSGKYIEQKHPLNIEFKYDSINENTVYLIRIEEKELTGNLHKIDNAIYFEDDVHIKLPHTSFNERVPNELNYELLSSDLNIKNLDGITFLVGKFDSFIYDFNESGAPLKFVLKKKETYTNSDEELSDDILNALAEQEENFIKLYPNPFQTDLVISYTLEEESYVEVKLTDINGTSNSIIEKGKQQKAGKHRYFFNGANLEKGIYIVTVTANNKRKTRIIVKK